jgi:hypothetical protein
VAGEKEQANGIQAALARGVKRRIVRASEAEASRAPARDPRWRSLVSGVRAIQMEVKRLAPERTIGLAGNPAAPQSAILVAELRLGRRLPPSYREFLAFSDGWPSFFENASLLGTGEIGRTRLDELENPRWPAADRLLPFGTDRAGASLFAFDTSVRRGDGELPVIAWVGGLGLDCRCFTSFLATVLQLCRAELATLRITEPRNTDVDGCAPNRTDAKSSDPESSDPRSTDPKNTAPKSIDQSEASLAHGARRSAG